MCKRFHIPPLRAEMPVDKGIEAGGTSKKVPPRFHPDSPKMLKREISIAGFWGKSLQIAKKFSTFALG
jgi:hypothetical protein